MDDRVFIATCSIISVMQSVCGVHLIDYPCFNWYWEISLTNRKCSIVWIQLPLFTGESYCWTIKHFDVWLEEIGVIDSLLQGQGYIFTPFPFWQSVYSSIGPSSILVPPFTYMIYYNVLVNLIFVLRSRY